MTKNDAISSVRVPTARFDEPKKVSAKADYYENICKNLLADDRFSEYSLRIAQAQTCIGKFRAAILKALSRTKGTVQARNLAEIKMKSQMDYLLAQIQVVGDNDPVNAITIFTGLGVTYKKRFPYAKKELKVTNGKISGTMNLMIKMPKGLFAVLWMYTTHPEDEDSWKIADFSHTSKGFIKGLQEATTYYFRARTSSSAKGKSDWTNMVEIICW